MATLRLFLDEFGIPPNADTEVDWVRLDAPGHGRCALSAVPTAKRLELIVPTQLVLIAKVQLPPGGRRQARKLVPLAVEPLILDDPTQQHVAYELLDGDSARVAVMDAQLLTGTLNTLKALGMKPAAIYHGADLLPPGSSSCWQVAIGRSDMQVIAEEALVCDSMADGSPPLLLRAAVAQSRPESIQLFTSPQVQSIKGWEELLDCQIVAMDEDWMMRPLRPDAINLLQGKHAAGASLDIDWRPLKPALWLTAAFAGLAFAQTVSSWANFKSEEKALKKEAETAFRTAFPNQPVVDVKLQLEALAKSRPANAQPTGAADAFSLMQAVAPHIAGHPEFKLARLEAKTDTLFLDLAGDAATNAGLAQSLKDAGLQVDDGKAPQTGHSRLIITSKTK